MAESVFPVGGKATVVSATPVLTVAATYASGDFVGTSATPITFADCALAPNGSGWITSAEFIDGSAAAGVAAELWLFDTTFTPPADSAAWTITDAEAKTCIMIIPFSVYAASAANCVAMGDNLPRKFKCASGTAALFGAIVTRGAPAYASLDVTIRLYIDQD